ncbi:hypothetical protein EVAR_34509_1 [Eumeta japonica]|uniref:Uncharacterized protein n=1 Tax=Eumeta variegata TaxID=151549 RepID=A0A4C1Z8B8_EUMVA|nr:hypothetical protein EVAR_34509_1 [Eumeta japonica]
MTRPLACAARGAVNALSVIVFVCGLHSRGTPNKVSTQKKLTKSMSDRTQPQCTGKEVLQAGRETSTMEVDLVTIYGRASARLGAAPASTGRIPSHFPILGKHNKDHSRMYVTASTGSRPSTSRNRRRRCPLCDARDRILKEQLMSQRVDLYDSVVKQQPYQCTAAVFVSEREGAGVGRRQRDDSRNTSVMWDYVQATCLTSGASIVATPCHLYVRSACCGWESLMKNVTLGNVTMSHRTREPAECLASLSHSTMIGLPRTRELVHSLQMYCKLLRDIRMPDVVPCCCRVNELEGHLMCVEEADSGYELKFETKKSARTSE